MDCSICSGETDHEVKEGRGLPPKSYKPHPYGMGRKISWKGIWDIYTCKECGNKDRKLRRN